MSAAPVAPSPTDYELSQVTHALGRAGHLNDRSVQHLLRSIVPGDPGPLNQRLWQDVLALIGGPITPAVTNPFPPAPVGIVSDRDIIIALDATTGEPITVGPEDIASNIVLPGATSSGKTTLILHLLAQIIQYVRLWVLDLKDDYRAIAAHHPRMVIIHPGAPYNLLTPPRHQTVNQADDVLINTLASTFYLGQTGKSELSRALQTTREERENACINDLITTLDAIPARNATYAERDAKRGLADRLRRFGLAYPGLSTTRHGFTLDTILDGHGLYIPATLYTENEEWLYTYHLTQLFLYQAHHHRRDGLDHVIVNDEGVRLWNTTSNHITGTPPVVDFVGKTRELSTGNLVSTNSWTTTHPALKSNANTLLITRLASHEDENALARTIGLTPEQAAFLNHHLAVGQVIIRLRDRYRQPLLGVFPPIPYNKAVHPLVWEAAKARTNLLAPTTPFLRTAPNVLRPSTGADASVEPTRTTVSPTSAPPPTARVTPATAPAERVIAINKHEEALLVVVCEGVTPSTPAYRLAGLSLADGDNASRRLAQKGLIHREKIVLHTGRGGHGMGLAATPSGYARAGKQRAVKTRGGDSVQHQYLVQELHRLLPATTVEALVGMKPVDLLLPCNTERDAQLLEYLRPHLPPSTTLHAGDLVALEVETSDPEKTAPNNITKNYDAGITLTLILALPKLVAATRKHLDTLIPVETHASFIVLNVLDLLTALQGGTP